MKKEERVEEKKKEGRGKERRKNERKDGSGRGRGEERKERTLRERFSGFSARIPTRVRSNRDEEGRQLGAEKGSSGWARVSNRTSASKKDPLLRPYYIVYLSSEPRPIPSFRVLRLPFPCSERARLRRAAALFPRKPDYTPALLPVLGG